jgi:hypothetical protein
MGLKFVDLNMNAIALKINGKNVSALAKTGKNFKISIFFHN